MRAASGASGAVSADQVEAVGTGERERPAVGRPGRRTRLAGVRSRGHGARQLAQAAAVAGHHEDPVMHGGYRRSVGRPAGFYGVSPRGERGRLGAVRVDDGDARTGGIAGRVGDSRAVGRPGGVAVHGRWARHHPRWGRTVGREHGDLLGNAVATRRVELHVGDQRAIGRGRRFGVIGESRSALVQVRDLTELSGRELRIERVDVVALHRVDDRRRVLRDGERRCGLARRPDLDAPHDAAARAEDRHDVLRPGPRDGEATAVREPRAESEQMRFDPTRGHTHDLAGRRVGAQLEVLPVGRDGCGRKRATRQPAQLAGIDGCEPERSGSACEHERLAVGRERQRDAVEAADRPPVLVGHGRRARKEPALLEVLRDESEARRRLGPQRLVRASREEHPPPGIGHLDPREAGYPEGVREPLSVGRPRRWACRRRVVEQRDRPPRRIQELDPEVAVLRPEHDREHRAIGRPGAAHGIEAARETGEAVWRRPRADPSAVESLAAAVAREDDLLVVYCNHLIGALGPTDVHSRTADEIERVDLGLIVRRTVAGEHQERWPLSVTGCTRRAGCQYRQHADQHRHRHRRTNADPLHRHGGAACQPGESSSIFSDAPVAKPATSQTPATAARTNSADACRAARSSGLSSHS
jgi:hypothetical protein